jgi:RNA polymerase sigma factor, sigma-70 family
MNAEQYKKEISRLRPEAMTLACRYLHDGEAAEDVVQEAFLKLWLLRDEVRSPLQPLAFAIIRNLCVNFLRRERWREDLPEDVADNGEDDCFRHERIERMMRVVDTLPDIQQTVLRLRHMDGMSLKDIAEVTGCTEVNIRKILSRARMAVRDKYRRKDR